MSQLNKKGQSSIEALILVTIVFIGILYLYSLFFTTNDSSLAAEIAKTEAIQKLATLNKFFYIEKIGILEKGAQEIEITVTILPPGHGLTESDFIKAQTVIQQKTKYKTATIKTA